MLLASSPLRTRPQSSSGLSLLARQCYWTRSSSVPASIISNTLIPSMAASIMQRAARPNVRICFRVENPATVYYLQQAGRTGQLTNLSVSNIRSESRWHDGIAPLFYSVHNATFTGSLAYGTAALWVVTVLILLGLAHDWWALGVILTLMISRLCNIVVIRRRATRGWVGASEPGKQGDLLILLSQDRWIRMKGAVDDLKRVRSGQWLRDETSVESWITALATLLVYLGAALVSNADQFGKILLLCLLFGSVGLLAVANVTTEELQMHGCIVRVQGWRKSYERRLHLINELIEESGRDDWAMRMALIVKDGDQVGGAIM